MVQHLVEDHGVREGTRGVLKLLEIGELLVIWWLHNHETDETEIECERTKQ